MTNKKISDLAAASTPLDGTELVPTWNGTDTVKVSIENLTAGRTVSAARIISGNTNSDLTLTASTSPTNGPFIQLYGLTSGAPGWAVYESGVADFASYGIESHWKSDFAGTSTYLGGWFSNGDYKISYGNLVQGTAAKGINFTANTPAAGMTSQLLNWYEEGTWTPVVTTASGAITAYTASATYTRVGRVITNNIRVDISNNGTGATGIIISGFPFTSSSAKQICGATREDTAVGIGIVASAFSANQAYLTTVTNAYPGGTGYGFSLTITQSV